MTWTILDKVKTQQRSMYQVQCGCGKIELRRVDHVDSGRTTSCKVCSAKVTASKYPPPVNRTGCNGLSGTHYLSIKTGADKRNIAFNVTPEYLWELFEKQHGLCAITNVQINLENKIKNNNVDWSVITASLDRIDSSKGYQPGNVWWVHKRVNRLKNDFSMDELLYWSQAIVKKHGNPEPSGGSDTSEGATTRDRDLRVSNVPMSAQPISEFAGKPWKEVVETIAARVYYKAFNTSGDDIV